MRIVTNEDITALQISPVRSVQWVREAFLLKNDSQLPPKISLHPQGIDFINTMPCILPPEYHSYGCKVVSRIEGQHPALHSAMMMFDTLSGKMTALLEADLITAMRTGAVAALAVRTLRSSDARVYGIMGLGAMGQSVIDCLIPDLVTAGHPVTLRFKNYKDHASRMIGHYGRMLRCHPHISFETADTNEDLVRDADVVISCITQAEGLLVEDVSLFKPGVLVVPVHTRGFQNCDTIFDKVFADDRGHVEHFKYFNRFRRFGELGDVLAGKIPGRGNDSERILSYNIGLALHDVFFANKILSLLNDEEINK